MHILNDPPASDPTGLMREELTRLGFEELRTPDEVDAALSGAEAPTLVFVNSVCGCAAGAARPAMALALRDASRRPARLATVFAGQDAAATARARQYFTGFAPSSPSAALLVSGRTVWMLERRDIQGRHPRDIAADIVAAFDRWCL